MKKLIDNVFRDDEPIESRDVKLKNIKALSKEFEKEENESFEDAFEEEVIRQEEEEKLQEQREEEKAEREELKRQRNEPKYSANTKT